MAKRYLSIDEAAERLGIAKEELNRLRQKGEIRGFADRGTFKFKEEDVEELARRMQPSSDPDVPMIDGEDEGSVLDEEPAADGSGFEGAPSIIRRLSGGGSSGSAEGEEGIGNIFDDFASGGASDSDVRLVMEGGSGLNLPVSDSDVRLAVPDESGIKIDLHDSDSDVRLASSGATAEDSAIKLGLDDSDSDVRLSDDSRPRFAPPESDSDVQLAPDPNASKQRVPKRDSDSDVMLVGTEPDSDSDVHLSTDEESGLLVGPQSDSDVQLVAADSDSDVRLLDESRLAGPKSKIKKDSDSDVAVLPDSGIALDAGSSVIGRKGGLRGEASSVLADDSDIALDQGSGISLGGDSGINLVGRQSGIALDRVADSGVSLEKKDADDDSGISLFDEESEGGITLAGDSGIALHADDEGSGLSLENAEDEEGGITLADIAVADSGIALKDDEDLQLTETMPAMKMPKKKPAGDENMSDTMLEVPSVDAEADMAESDFEIGAADGSQGDTSVLLFDDEDETDDGGAAMVKKKAGDEEEEESFEFSDAEEEEAAEVAEAEEDVFAGDEAFEEDSEFGESESDFETTVAKSAVSAPVEYAWGAGVVSTLAVSTIVMLVCGMASIDLVRSMWGWQGYSAVNGPIIEMLGGLFK